MLNLSFGRSTWRESGCDPPFVSILNSDPDPSVRQPPGGRLRPTENEAPNADAGHFGGLIGQARLFLRKFGREKIQVDLRDAAF